MYTRQLASFTDSYLRCRDKPCLFTLQRFLQFSYLVSSRGELRLQVQTARLFPTQWAGELRVTRFLSLNTGAQVVWEHTFLLNFELEQLHCKYRKRERI